MTEEPAGDAAENRGDGCNECIKHRLFRLGQHHGQEKHIRRHDEDGAFHESHDRQPPYSGFARSERHRPGIDVFQHFMSPGKSVAE
ncbi:hypothetical protein D3C86_1601910 [compost metagenome]